MKRAWVFGDNVDTDVIIPARYLNTSDPKVLGSYCMQDTDHAAFKAARDAGELAGDYIVAGENFGCGSSREHAPIAIKAAGIRYVVARSFARIFFRNSYNMGFPVIECPDAVDRISEGNLLSIDAGAGVITNETKGETYRAHPIPDFMQHLLDAGGLMPWVVKQLREQEAKAAGI
ncbi:MAG: 3-isopropylmalate dehydratase small subunit [Candidatus Aenigmarchaeota archaeon]|nr:3-isopropylmalate dehydratase small subunit [Candidatus Aenigmarchaeota archaeon]